MKKNLSFILIAFFLFTSLSPSVQAQTTYDADLDSVYRVNGEYTMTPLHHCDTFKFGGRVVNNGTGTITDVAVAISYSTAFQDTLKFDSIQAGAADSSLSILGFMPTAVGSYTFDYETDISETDANTANNDGTNSFEITDTVFAREKATPANGLGFTGGSGYIGQRFSLKVADTITSITFYLDNPTIGDSCKAHIHNWNGNIPGSIIQTTKTVSIIAGQNWYTAMLECPAIVTSGDYFASVEQLTTNNLQLGFTNINTFAYTVYYDGGAGWTAVDSIAVTTLEKAVLGLRVNVGPYDTYREVNITASKDTVCELSQVLVSGDKIADYSWSPASLALSPTSQNTFFRLSTATEITVVADFGCGLTATDSLIIFVKKSPTATVTPDTSICAGNSITLEAAGGTSYRWINGPTDSDWTVTPKATSVYNVLVDSSNGCSKSFNTEVTLNEATITVSADTTACSGLPITVSADDASTYAWLNGPNTASYTFDVTTTGYKYVTGTNSFGCIASDSVLVTALESPQLTPMNDTGACFTKFITIKPGGTADTYLWSDGSAADSVKFQMLAAKTWSLIASNANGCMSYDTVLVSRFLNPAGSIDSDTTICEGTELTMKAYGGDTYEWSNGVLTQENEVSPLTETKYDVVIRSAEGCEDFEDITVSVDPLPIAAFSYRDFKDSVVFTNKSQLATSYLWSFGDGATSTDEDTYHIYTDSADYTIVLTATNDCGDVDSSITINVKVPKKVNGIADLALWKNMTIYPNPSSGLLHYTIDNPLVGVMHVSIIDIAGKTLYTTSSIKGSNEIEGTLDIATLTNGIYFVEFRVNNSVVRTKVIKN